MSLVVFHMHGCPHCKAVTGEESVLRSVADLLPVVEVESSDPLARTAGVKSFPTIMLVTPAVSFEYQGPRTPEAIRNFVSEKMEQLSMLVMLKKKLSR